VTVPAESPGTIFMFMLKWPNKYDPLDWKPVPIQKLYK